MSMPARKQKEGGGTIRLGDIVIDPQFQVRMKINPHTVKKYADCMAMGDIFPPVVIDKKNGKLVCGFTRYEAYTKAFTPDYLVPVSIIEFKDKKEIFKFAAEDNKFHGDPLSSWDKKNLISKMIQFKFTPEEISKSIGWPISRIESLAGMKVVVVGSDGDEKDEDKPESKRSASQSRSMTVAMVDGQERVIKSGLSHMNGKEISQEVYNRIVENYMGMPGSFFANQILMRIEDGTLDIENEAEEKALKALYVAFKRIFK